MERKLEYKNIERIGEKGGWGRDTHTIMMFSNYLWKKFSKIPHYYNGIFNYYNKISV